MASDPRRVANTREWLEYSFEDLRAGANDLRGSPPLARHALFNAEQAVEKAMKAMLAWHDRPFPWTHDLVALGNLVAEVDPDLESALSIGAAELTKYGSAVRYPGQPGRPTVEQARAALALASDVVEAILARLPQEVRP